MNKNSSYKYFPSLQFLRGLSVLLVFLFHSNYIFLKNGYQGVYIFFTISGFIIPYIYFNKQYTLKQFYINRFKRIYPLLILVLFTTLIFYFFFWIFSNYK